MAQNSITSGASLRKHGRDHDNASSVSSSRIGDVSEWEANEALRQRELEEAKGRAAQMEKTMRWWSDCTANWREKWSKVRNERNKAREECKQLRSKLETVIKEASTFKRDKEEIESQNDQLKREIEKIHLLLLKHAGQFETQILEALGEEPLKDFVFNNIEGNHGSPVKELNVVDVRDRLNGVSSSQSNPECDSTAPASINSAEDNNVLLLSPKSKYLNANIEENVGKISMLQLKLDEATKTINLEREEKDTLHRNLDRVNSELQEEKEKCDELKDAKQEAIRQLLNLQDDHEKELQRIKADLLEEIGNREAIERKLNDLRTELERLQAENAAEWAKRERLETEKVTLERDNKKIRNELRDLQERLERKSNRTLSNSDMEIRHLQQEISDKNKEVCELKHTQSKLRKLLQDKVTELAHASRRAEQYETEVKKLRTRVEELKKDLAIAEDDLDNAQNNVRKLQRTNDELQEQADNFQLQLQHLHTRLRNQNPTSLLSSSRGKINLTSKSESDVEDDFNEYL